MSKKIWIMNHYASSMYRDQAGRHFWFAQELKKCGYDATVFCANTFLNNEKQVEIEKGVFTEKKTEDIPFVFVKTVVSTGNGIERIKNMGLFYKNLFPATRGYAKEHGKPDVILASSVHPLTMVAGIKIARKMDVPCICEIRDLWPEAIFRFGKAKENSLIGSVLTRGEHWIYRNADALIFTKEGDTDYLKEKQWTTDQDGDIDLEKCHYINNGVDIAAYDRNITETVLNDEDLDSSCFNVIYAGSIRPINHVGNILDAASIISTRKGYERVRFLVFGDGSELPVLKERVKNEKLFNVRLKGFVERKYIPNILSKSSVNILNYAQQQYNWSRGNSSNKLFEYMASGKPIISTVRMGYSIIDRYRCGVELEQDTPEALAEEIMKFHDMSKEQLAQMGENARNGAKDFDVSVMTQKLVKVIKSVMK